MDWPNILSNCNKKDLLKGDDPSINARFIPFLGCNRIGIVSSSIPRKEVVEKQMHALGLDIEIQVYNNMFKNGQLFKKPSPWMIWYALNKMGVENYDEVLYIGGRADDHIIAEKARVNFTNIEDLLKLI